MTPQYLIDERNRRSKSAKVACVGEFLLAVILILPVTIPLFLILSLNPMYMIVVPLLMAILAIPALGLIIYGMLGSVSRNLF